MLCLYFCSLYGFICSKNFNAPLMKVRLLGFSLEDSILNATLPNRTLVTANNPTVNCDCVLACVGVVNFDVSQLV